MAGMLPGVEAARRRRFHQSSHELLPTNPGCGGSSIRRSSFCLYASSHEYHLSSTSSMRNPSRQTLFDESKLGAEALEAKKRLDRRLQHQWKSQTKRSSSGQQGSRSLDERPIITQADFIIEMPRFRKSGSRRLNWLRLNWKSSEQEECAVCLEHLKGEGKTVMQLPCAHKFHTKCLVPWLESNAHCPCCRMEIPS